MPLAIAATLLLRLAASAAGTALALDLAERARAGGDVTAATLALLGAAFYAVELLGSPLFGAAADRVGYRPVMLVGPAAGGLAALLLNLPGGVLWWLASRAGQGVSTAASVPATLGYVARATHGDTAARARAMAFFEVSTGVGLFGGVVAGAGLWGRLGATTYLVLVGVYGLALGLFALVAEPPAATGGPEAQPGWAERLALLRDPRVVAFAPAWLAVNATVGVWTTHATFQMASHRFPDQYLMNALGPTQIGLVQGAYGLVFLVGLIGWGWLIPRVGVGRALWVSLGGIALADLAVGAVNHLPPPLREAAVGFFVLTVVVEAGFVPAALVRLAQIADADAGGASRGLVMGVYSLLLGLGQLLGGAVGTPFADWRGVDGIVAVTALLLTAAAASLRYGTRPGDSNPASAGLAGPGTGSSAHRRARRAWRSTKS
jgi:MFS family permease